MAKERSTFIDNLGKIYGVYTGIFVLFVIALGVAAGFFPALVMGIWSKRTTKTAAILGMILGLGVTLFYMIGNRFYGLNWFGIKHISSAIFGLPVGFITMWLVSRFTPEPPKELQDFVESVRYPKGAVKVAEE